MTTVILCLISFFLSLFSHRMSSAIRGSKRTTNVAQRKPRITRDEREKKEQEEECLIKEKQSAAAKLFEEELHVLSRLYRTFRYPLWMMLAFVLFRWTYRWMFAIPSPLFFISQPTLVLCSGLSALYISFSISEIVAFDSFERMVFYLVLHPLLFSCLFYLVGVYL
jgi:hypothetical protein